MGSYRITELPIPWYFNPETKLSPLKDALRMGLDILTIHRNARRGHLCPKKLTLLPCRIYPTCGMKQPSGQMGPYG